MNWGSETTTPAYLSESGNGPNPGNSEGSGDSNGSKADNVRGLALALLQEADALEGIPALGGSPSVNLNEEVRRFEIRLIVRALEQAGGVQRRAAQLLNIKPTTLNAKLRVFGIDPRQVSR